MFDDLILQAIDFNIAFSKLILKHQVVVAMRLAGYKQHECAVVFGLTRAAIGIMHKKARAELRREMLKHDNT